MIVGGEKLQEHRLILAQISRPSRQIPPSEATISFRILQTPPLKNRRAQAHPRLARPLPAPAFSTTPAGPPPSGTSLFGGLSKPSANQPTTTSTSTGNAPTFSFAKPEGGSSGSLFGEITQNKVQSSPFTLSGAGTTQSTAGQGPSATATSGAQPSTSLALPSGGNTFVQTKSTGSSLFGTPTTTSSAADSSTATAPTASTNLFSSKMRSTQNATTSAQPSAAATAPAPSLFGATTASTAAQPPATTTNFCAFPLRRDCPDHPVYHPVYHPANGWCIYRRT